MIAVPPVVGQVGNRSGPKPAKCTGRYGAEKHKRPGAARDLATDIADCGLEMHQSKRR